MELIRNSIKLNQNDCVSVMLELKKITGTFINLKYSTLLENNPNKNQNYIALWSVSSSNVPWGTKPKYICEIKSPLAENDISFHEIGLPEGKYLLAYSLVPKDETKNESSFCTSAYISSLKTPVDEVQYHQTSISIADFGSSYLNISYHTLPMFNPGGHQNWLGVWEAGTDIYTELPIQSVVVNKTSSTGDVSFDNIDMVSGKSYIVCYFMNGYSEKAEQLSRDALACYVTFDIE